MAEIGMGSRPGVFKGRKRKFKAFTRDYNHRVSSRSVVSSLDSRFESLNPTSPFAGRKLTRAGFDRIVNQRGGSGVRPCKHSGCGHSAIDHRSTDNYERKPAWCTVPDCPCEQYKR